MKTIARARLEGGHRVPAQVGAAAVPRAARLPPGRLRLHHLHRQQRTAARRDRRRDPRARPGRGRGALAATATSRAASSRTCAPTTWPRRRWSWPTRWPASMNIDLTTRAARRRHATASRSTCRTSGRPSRRSRRRCSAASPPRRSARSTPTCSRATSGGGRCRCRPATASRGTTTPPTSAGRRSSKGCR